MKDFLEQIKAALDSNLYYLALSASLIVPDICGALESTDGLATGDKYKKWFDTWVAKNYNGNFDGQDCWYFRCSLLHQGSSFHPRGRYSKVIFVEPTATTSTLHNNILNDAFNIDVRWFCMDVVCAAEKWLLKTKNSRNFTKNYKNFMQRYPGGLPPYIDGVGVIA